MLQLGFAVFAFVALSSPVYALDEESAKEIKCFNITKTVPMIFDGPHSEPKPMYYTLMSRLELYRQAQDITKRDFKNITDDELYYDSCIRFSGSPDGSCITTGFGGISIKREIRPLDPGQEQLEFGDKDGKGWHGHCYLTLTDNKTLIFQACCSNGNEMHWGVVSTEKVMSKENVKMVHDHAESLGFSKEYFTALRYDSCGNE